MAASSVALDAPAEAGAAAEPAAKGGKKKLLLIVGVLVVAAVGFFFLKPGKAAEPAEPVPPKPGEVVEVGQMTVNLADASRYARVSFSLMLIEGATADLVTPKYPLLKEAVLFEVSKLSAAQVRTPGGLDALAKVLTTRAQEIYEGGEVMRVVLTEMLVQ